MKGSTLLTPLITSKYYGLWVGLGVALSLPVAFALFYVLFLHTPVGEWFVHLPEGVADYVAAPLLYLLAYSIGLLLVFTVEINVLYWMKRLKYE